MNNLFFVANNDKGKTLRVIAKNGKGDYFLIKDYPYSTRVEQSEFSMRKALFHAKELQHVMGAANLLQKGVGVQVSKPFESGVFLWNRPSFTSCGTRSVDDDILCAISPDGSMYLLSALNELETRFCKDLLVKKAVDVLTFEAKEELCWGYKALREENSPVYEHKEFSLSLEQMNALKLVSNQTKTPDFQRKMSAPCGQLKLVS